MDNGAQNKTVYVEPVPLGKGYLLSEKQSFLARTVELPEDVSSELIRKMREFELLQGWLATVYQAASRRGTEIEVPEQVRNVLCPVAPSAETPKSTASEAPSRKKSPTQRRKTKSSSTTSLETE